MTSAALNLLILLAPLLIGAAVAAVNSGGANDATERAEAWIRRRRAIGTASPGRLSRWVVNPFLWMIVRFCDWTDGLAHRGLKNGIRIAATLYLVAIWLMLLYAAVAVAIAIVIFGAILYAMAQGIGNSMGGSNERGGSEPGSRRDEDVLRRAGPRGRRIYSGTNWLNEELEGRVDDDGNIYKGTNWLTEEKIGRIDDEGNIYRGASWMSEEKVGRIAEDGTLYKGTNWFNEEKTGRIDEDGDLQEGTNWLNERKRGRVGVVAGTGHLASENRPTHVRQSQQ